MHAAGEYGEVPQYVATRVGASQGHMFSVSREMSLSSSASAQTHAHGHVLSLSQSPAHSEASQSRGQAQIAQSTQPLFLQSQHPHQQHAQAAPNASMGGCTASAALPTSQSTHTLQPAAQELQADLKQHQQQLLYIRPEGVHDLGAQGAASTHEQSVHNGDPISQVTPTELPTAARGDMAAIAVLDTQDEMAMAELEKAAKEETSGDGDDVEEEGERGIGANRWPREEALALLKIRSEMDSAFRDSSLKGPLWEAISRKLAHMGYNRSAKKCKEKFENVHKYYKRTKEGKTGRQDGKSYRFFAQLEALYGKTGVSNQQQHLQYHDHHMSNSFHLTNLNPNSFSVTNPNASGSGNTHSHSGGLFPGFSADNPASAIGSKIAATAAHIRLNNMATGSTVAAALPLAAVPSCNPSSVAAATAGTNAHIARTLERVESTKHETDKNNFKICCSDASDAIDDDYDDEDEEEEQDNDDGKKFGEPATHESAELPATRNAPGGKKRKRKSLKKCLALFEKIMKRVLDEQEQMQQKLLEALERRDQDRMIREEAWKRQEMARLNREHDMRAAERTLSASMDASLMAILQKMTGQTIALPHSNSVAPSQVHNYHSTSSAIVPADYIHNESNADRDPYDPSSSKRWPKPEVLALIKLRTSLDRKFHEPGPKAVLWEEISAKMASQGLARTAKRCKQKWENINKYFKKAKHKKRPENAKTCPYFHHLNALYKEGLLSDGGGGGAAMAAATVSSQHLIASEKVEIHPEGVVEQQRVDTINHRGEESEQMHDNVSAVAPLQNGALPSGLPNAAEPQNAIIAISAAALSHMPSSARSDTKVHMFMGMASSVHGNDGRAGVTKAPGLAAPPAHSIKQSEQTQSLSHEK